jgi:S1-C subfamily serine protease
MIPPHLPPPASNINKHKKWQHIKIFIMAACFGVIGGGSGAAMMIGWVWPIVDNNNQWVTPYFQSSFYRVQLEEKTREEMKDRMATVYRDVSDLSGVNYFSSDNKIGDAAIVSSDGWVVAYNPFENSTVKNPQIISSSGKVLKIDRSLYDRNTGLSFFKISASSSLYKQVEFGENFEVGDDAFVFQDREWEHSLISRRLITSKDTFHLDGAPILFYTLSSNFKPGSWVLNKQGRLIGVITEDQQMLPSRFITSLLPSILTKQSLAYQSFGVEGSFSEQQPIVSGGTSISGFMVNQVIAKTSPLKKGDVLLEINNEIVNPDFLWYTLKNNSEAKIKILRQGKNITITVPIISISL